MYVHVPIHTHVLSVVSVVQCGVGYIGDPIGKVPTISEGKNIGKCMWYPPGVVVELR